MTNVVKIERKRKERQSNQKHIIDAARLLFAKNGIENSRMEEIAVAAGYTRRTLYSYFKSRDEIMLAIFTDDLNIRWAFQKKAVAEYETGLDQLYIWGKTFYEFVCDNPHTMQLQLYWDYKGINRKIISDHLFKQFEKINNELAKGLKSIFDKGIKDGTMRSDLDIDMCISQFLYSFRSILKRSLSSSYSFAHFDEKEYVEHYLDLFKRSIKSQDKLQ